MTIIWGFDLSEMHWGAFGSRNMFDRRWHLRRERFIVYQLAMMIGLAAECTATYSLSKYEDLQDHIEQLSVHTALVHNNNIIDAAIVTIVFCVLVATVFGADFFFLLFWPRRRYPRWYDVTKRLFAVIISLGMAIATLTSTVIVARQSATITGVDAATAQQYTDLYFRPPLVYRHWATNIAWVVLLWPAFLSTVASTYIMFIASSHDRELGTEPETVEGEKDTESLPIRDEEKKENEDPSAAPTPPNEKVPEENGAADRDSMTAPTTPEDGSTIPIPLPTSSVERLGHM